MILNYKTQIQLLDHWCWAAVASSISRFYSASSQWSQSALAGALIKPICSSITPENKDLPPAGCDQINDLKQVLGYTKNFAWVIEGKLTLGQLQGQLYAGWPICCEINWPGFDTSHYITIYGYSGSTIMVGDPDSGPHAVHYDDLITSYRSGIWKRTIGTCPSLPIYKQFN